MTSRSRSGHALPAGAGLTALANLSGQHSQGLEVSVPWRSLCAFLVLVVLFCGGCTASDIEPRSGTLKIAMEKLRPLHQELGTPQPGDWLDGQEEQGQTFREYLDRKGRQIPSKERHKIYVQPIGDFSTTQSQILQLAAEFIGLYFGMPTQLLDPLPLSLVPDEARRKNPSTGNEQILTYHVMHGLLGPRIPSDAAVCLAMTSADLWSGATLNYCFGEAGSFHGVGVGVASMQRFGNPDENEESFRLCLLRTLKNVTHEIGHDFAIYHCTAYRCNMCGRNHLEEADLMPLWCCPECAAKICLATGSNPVERYRKLAAFCGSNGLRKEGSFFERSASCLESNRLLLNWYAWVCSYLQDLDRSLH